MSDKILVLKGKRRAYVSKEDLAAANAVGFREPKPGDVIEGLKVVPVEEKKEPKPKAEKSDKNVETTL